MTKKNRKIQKCSMILKNKRHNKTEETYSPYLDFKKGNEYGLFTL